MTINLTVSEYTMAAVVTALGSYVMLEFIEQTLGLYPRVFISEYYSQKILQAQSLNELAVVEDKTVKTEQAVRDALRLSRTLDLDGRYRIQTRGSIYFIKTFWALLWLFVVIAYAKVPAIVDHIWNQKKGPISNEKWYLMTAASLTIFYLWELGANRYYKLDWSVIGHHVITIAAGVHILLGGFNPFASWWALVTVMMSFPYFFALAIRASLATQCPGLTKGLFDFCKWYFLALVVVNTVTQVVIFVRAIQTNSLPVGLLVIIAIVALLLTYTDVDFSRALFSIARQDYHEAAEVNIRAEKAQFVRVATALYRLQSSGLSQTETNLSRSRDAAELDMAIVENFHQQHPALPVVSEVEQNENNHRIV